MGIEQFFSSIESNTINTKNKFTYKHTTAIDGKNIFIDFNSIVYITSSEVINDINYLIYNDIYKKPIDDKAKQLLIDFNIKKPNEAIELKSKIDDIILDRIFLYIQFIIAKLIDPSLIEFIYIAIDGVPNKNKMIEQRKRRYMAAIINIYKKELFDKYVDNLDNNRYYFEINKAQWNRNSITPGTEFMYKLNLMLQGSYFEIELKKICPNLKQYIYSGPYVFGEGEKKIMDYIYTHLSTDYIIYSPDSDMTILSLILLSHNTCSIKLLRHNQQQNDYDVIDINALFKNIISLVKSINNIIKYNESSIIRDLSFIMTIFGNDYIPKIESFDVKYDFILMVNVYLAVLSKNNINLITVQSGKYVLNNLVLQNIIEELSKYEHNHLHRKYLMSNYSNYQYIKQTLGANDENFLDKLQNALDNLDILSKLTNLDKNFVAKSIKDNRFIIFKRNELSFSNEKYYDRFKKQNFDTLYDKEIFKLDNMLDQYTTYFNADLTDIGKINVQNNGSKLSLHVESLSTSIQKYYNRKFDVHNNDIKTITHKYLEGLCWVFNYYFNNYGYSNPNIWFYEYDHAPLLSSIFKYYIDIDKFAHNDYETNLKLYFNTFEHFLYVSPLRLLNLPNYIKKYEKISIDVKKKITSGKLIDCNNALYLTKCHINLFSYKSWLISYKDDLKFIDEIRKIKTNYEINKLIGDNSDHRVFIANYHDLFALSSI